MRNTTLLEILTAEKVLELELQRRAVRPIKARVMEPVKLPALKVPLFREGTIVCLSAPDGSKILARLEAALKDSDKKEIESITKELLSAQSRGHACCLQKNS